MSDKKTSSDKQPGKTEPRGKRRASRPPTLDLKAVDMTRKEADAKRYAAKTEPPSNPPDDAGSKRPDAAPAAKPAPETKTDTGKAQAEAGKSAPAAKTQATQAASASAPAGPAKSSTAKPENAKPENAKPETAKPEGAAPAAAERGGKPQTGGGTGGSGGSGAAGKTSPSPSPFPSGMAATGQMALAAGLGALIFLVAFVAFRLMEGDGDPRLAASLDRLESKIGALETRGREAGNGQLQGIAGIAGTAEAARAEAASLAKRLAALETRVENQPENEAGAVSPAEAALGGRVSALESDIADLSEKLSGAQAGLADMKAALDTAISEAGDSTPGPAELRIGEVAARAERLEGDISALAKRVDGAVSTRENLAVTVADLTARLNELARDRSPSEADIDRLGGELAALGERLSAAEAAIKAATTTDPAAALAAEKDLGEKLARLETLVSKAALARRAAGNIALDAMMEKLRAGAGFAEELNQAEALAPDLAVPEKLRMAAKMGVASLDDLRSAAQRLPAPEALSDTAPGKPTEETATKKPAAAPATLMERLMASAGKLVSIRRTGEAKEGGENSPPTSEKEQTPGPLQPMRAALARGDLAGALVAGGALPESYAPTARPLMERIAERRDVIAEAERYGEALQGRLSATAAPAQGPDAGGPLPDAGSLPETGKGAAQ